MTGGKHDVAVVGAGIVGLATARALQQLRPSLRIAVVDKEACVGAHQSSHNSGVIHSGLYYRPGSLKARLCVEGARELERFADAHGIPWERCGKLVVAVDPAETGRLADLMDRGLANGLEGLRLLDARELREYEPHVAGVRALLVPGTGIIDFATVTGALAHEVAAAGGEVLLGREVRAIRTGDGAVIQAGDAEVSARFVVTCAGLNSDRVAALTDPLARRSERIVPFRGDYYTLRPAARGLVRNLVYPVPDPALPFLGVHFTRRIDGEVWAGPNAVLAGAREGYRRRDIDVRHLAGVAAFPGFWRLARRHWRTQAGELWREAVASAFVSRLRRYVPAIGAGDLTFGPTGVRAQALAADGTMVDDFSLTEGGPVLHVRNAPSPAATAALAIGREVAQRALARFSP